MQYGILVLSVLFTLGIIYFFILFREGDNKKGNKVINKKVIFEFIYYILILLYFYFGSLISFGDAKNPSIIYYFGNLFIFAIIPYLGMLVKIKMWERLFVSKEGSLFIKLVGNYIYIYVIMILNILILSLLGGIN